MKKLIPLLLIALLLTACTAAPQGNPDQQITRGTTPNEDVVTTTEATQAEQTDAFAFQVGETLVVPGTLFDATKVSYDDVYEVPSCAGEGTDKVYITADYEITAYHDGKSEITYSVIFVSPAVQTNEGLALGDDIAKASTLYGEPEVDGNAWVFTRGDTQLWVIGENNTVIAIELRWINA